MNPLFENYSGPLTGLNQEEQPPVTNVDHIRLPNLYNGVPGLVNATTLRLLLDEATAVYNVIDDVHSDPLANKIGYFYLKTSTSATANTRLSLNKAGEADVGRVIFIKTQRDSGATYQNQLLGPATPDLLYQDSYQANILLNDAENTNTWLVVGIVRPDAPGTYAWSVSKLTSTASGGGGADPYIKTDTGKTIIFAKTGSTTYTVSGGVGTLTIANFGDCATASIVVERTEDGVNNAFTLVVKFSDNSVNTWNTTTNNDPTLHDVYVPSAKYFNIGATAIAGQQSFTDMNAGASAMVPTYEFGNGEVRFKFSSGSQFGTTTRMLIQLHFARK